jgi:PEP-CTERM motif
MTSILRPGLVALLFLAAVAGPARADGAHIFLTEQGSVLSYDLLLNGFAATGTADLAPQGDLWQIGGEFGPNPLVVPVVFTPDGNSGSVGYYATAWREPGDGDLYNILFWSPSGNHGTTQFVVLSDAPASGQVFGFDYSLSSACFAPSLTGGTTPCPILNNGQSFSFGYSDFGRRDLGTVTENFDDRGDTAGGVPEPGPWTLMISGFGLIGAALRRRRAAVAA